jgi:SAM-dependent methyltransferase
VGEPRIDVAALVAEIRAEAERLRATLPDETGPPESREAAVRAAAALVPSPVSSIPTGRGRTATAVSGRLAALVDPQAVRLHSHRGRLGTLVVGAKRLLLRLLTPAFTQQAAFNREVHDTLVGMADTAEALDSRLAAIEAAVERGLGVSAMGELPFDYAAFEAEFRSSPETVRAAQSGYLDLFPSSASGPVLDVGCGRGEFLLHLVARGIAARGVDHDEGMAAAARTALVAAGATQAEVIAGDLFEVLEACADGSLGGVTAFQVAEHLGLSRVVRLLRTARRKLRPGGVIVLEVPNVASLIVHTRAWTIDPTHHQPLHPLALRHIVDHCGFTAVELRFSGPVEPELLLEGAGEGDAAARNFARLNRVLFAPQDYAVVARA